LVIELGYATDDRLAALRDEVFVARAVLTPGLERAGTALESLRRARVGLEDLIDRFRVIARGVYPAVLRDQGPMAALEELAADLPRPVRLTGDLGRRLSWEVESGIYYLTASAIQQLAGRPAERELLVHLEHADGRLSVRVEDTAPVVAAQQVRDALAGDAERLATLGGELELNDPAAEADGTASAAGSDVATSHVTAHVITLHAWLPDRLEPQVGQAPAEAWMR
jgi:signal transduction histidine kinase